MEHDPRLFVLLPRAGNAPYSPGFYASMLTQGLADPSLVNINLAVRNEIGNLSTQIGGLASVSSAEVGELINGLLFRLFTNPAINIEDIRGAVEGIWQVAVQNQNLPNASNIRNNATNINIVSDDDSDDDDGSNDDVVLPVFAVNYDVSNIKQLFAESNDSYYSYSKLGGTVLPSDFNYLGGVVKIFEIEITV